MIAAQMGDTRVPRQDHLDAADGAARPAADRPQAPGPRRGAHPAVLSDRRSRDPADVRDPREEARVARARSRTCRRFRSAGSCRARTSRAWSAARWRTSLLAGADHITREALAEVVSQFMPSTQGLERELQETAAILECTDTQFLPPGSASRRQRRWPRGLQARLTAVKQLVREL